MKKLTEKLFREYRRVDGLRFLAYLTDSSLGNSQVQKVPFRMLVVRSPVLVEVKDLVEGPHGEKILLMEHPSDNDYVRNFKAGFCRDALPWSRMTSIVDPVTGFQRDEVEQSLGVVYVNLDTPVEETTLGLMDTEYRFLTGQDVKVRDKVGDKIVKRVVNILGVKLVYASGP